MTELEKNVQFLKDFAKAYNIPYYNEFVLPYISSYLILNEIEHRKQTAFTDQEFSKLLKNSQFLFHELNDYEKEKGNLKISKKIEHIEKYYTKYKEHKKIPPFYQRFFNTYTTIHLPTKENVYTLIKHRFFIHIKHTIVNKKEAQELTNQLLADLFNIKKFRSNLKYKRIEIPQKRILELDYTIKYTKVKYSEKYIFEKINLLSIT